SGIESTPELTPDEVIAKRALKSARFLLRCYEQTLPPQIHPFPLLLLVQKARRTNPLHLEGYLMIYAASRVLVVLTVFAAMLVATLGQAQSQYPNYPSETPDKFHPATSSFDYERRIVMIPMRDGVKLHTVILVPKGAKNAPILLTRTPYDADSLTENSHSSHLGSTLWGYDNATEVIIEGGYIRVVQDIRGRHNSEGDYVMNRPLHGRLNPTPVDHSTDTYDTIDWLVKNIPESNGKVGIL